MATNRVSTDQGGSTTSFLLVGIALIILVIGSIYVLRVREAGTATEPVASPSKSNSVKKGDSKSKTATQSQSKNTIVRQEKVDSSNGVSRSLPSTGPSDDISTVVTLSVVTWAVVSYAQSRKSRARLLYR